MPADIPLRLIPPARRRGFWRLLCIPVLAGAMAGCDDFPQQAEERARAAFENDEILVAIVDSSSTPSLFAKGAMLAVEEFNRHATEQKLIAKQYDDRGKVEKAGSLARKLARNEEVVAVIGHLSSATAMVASIIYERAGLVLITPSTTQVHLTRFGTRFIFRNIPPDATFAQKAARYVRRHQYRKVAIIYDHGLPTRHLAKLFHWAINDADGVEVVIAQFYSTHGSGHDSGHESDYREVIARVKKKSDFDVLFLSGELPEGARIIRQLRAMGVSVPIIGSVQLDFRQLLEVAGKAAENTTIMTVFDPGRSRQVTRSFVRRFEERYGVEPDTWAAKGYDAIKLLTYAIDKGKSHIPAMMATMLRFVKDRKGVVSEHSMSADGDLLGEEIFFKTVKEGVFSFRDVAD